MQKECDCFVRGGEKSGAEGSLNIMELLKFSSASYEQSRLHALPPAGEVERLGGAGSRYSARLEKDLVCYR